MPKARATHQRADARKNRARVIAIAEQAFAADGVGVPIDDIARRAGVGIGTVYRHFPTKEALIAAVVHDKLARVAAYVAERAGDKDPGVAFFAVLDRMIADGAHKKDLVDVLTGAGVDLRSQAQGASAELREALGTLLRRAQKAKAVRGGVTAGDVLALLAATLSAAQRTGGSPQRLFAIVRDGLRA